MLERATAQKISASTNVIYNPETAAEVRAVSQISINAAKMLGLTEEEIACTLEERAAFLRRKYSIDFDTSASD